LLDRYLKRTITFFIIVFIAWVSFVPEPWQLKCGLQVKYALSILLLLSFWRHKFDFEDYFFRGSDAWFWVYLFLISLNIPFAQDKKLALGFYKDFSLSVILVFFLIRNELTQSNIKKIFYVLCLFAAAVCLFGFWEVLTKTNIIYVKLMYSDFYTRYIKLGRMMSTLIHPNILGAYLIACLPIAVYFYKAAEHIKVRIINRGIILVILAAIILTYSRGTYVAFVLMVFISSLLKRRIRWVVIVGLICIIFLLAVSTIPGHGNVFVRFRYDHLVPYALHGHRTAQYLVTFYMLKVHPLAGIGLNSYRQLFNQYTHLRFPYEVMIPDSIYLMQLAEAGIIGFFGFILFLGGLFWNARRMYRRLSGDDKDLFLAIMMGFLALLFNMAFFDGFLWRTPLYLFWFFAAAIASFNYRKA